MLDREIRTLLVVVKRKSFTLAAEELHLTQPAVSHHIKQLEEDFGIRIFQPDKRELRFTPEGKILYKYARQAYEIEQAARQAIADSYHNIYHLRCGITHSAGESLIPRMIAQYGVEHPDAAISIITDRIKHLYRRLEEYELDIIVVEGPDTRPGFRSVLLDTDHLALIVSPQHPFAKRGSIRLAELKSEKLVMRGEKASTRQLFEQYLMGEAETMHNFHVMMEIDNVAAIKELVSMNYGVSIIAHSACRAEVEAGRLVEVPIENARMTRDVSMIFRDDYTHTGVLDGLSAIYRQISIQR